MITVLLALSALLAALLVRRFEGDESNDPVVDGGDGDGWPGLQAIEIGVGPAGDLPGSIEATPENGTGLWRVTFTLASDVLADDVAVSGDFNGWSTQDQPMERAADGRWRTEALLSGGVYRYKFFLDGDRWLTDPENPEREDDGFESENSVLRLGPLGNPGLDAALAPDGQFRTDALQHDGRQPLYLHRISGNRVRLRYRTLAGDVERVLLLSRGRPASPMDPITSPEPFQFWETIVELPAERSEYTFGLENARTCVCDPRVHSLDPESLVELTTPDWAKHAVWYQIFPERFRNGDEANDPRPVRSWTSDWYESAPWEGADGQTFWEYFVYQRMYGGDIAGILEKLDHLVELGVTAIYLNPIFHASTPHKYNATDFRHVDTHFGAGEDYAEATADENLLDPSTWVWTPSDRVFLEFLRECKSRGLRVILDAVFNHVGVAHPAFRDVQERGEESPYRDWFRVRSWDPFEYAGWAGFGDLPVFAKDGSGFDSDSVKEHVFAVTRRWMDPDGDGDPSDGIDGWRLDVPMEIRPAFWEEWRAHVKSINPDAYISGEIWHRADEWLGGRHFDAVMNYRFADAIVAWIGNIERKISASELDRRLLELRLAYPDEATYALMNLVDSHDTDRIASMLLNPDRPYDRSNRIQRNDDYNSGRPHDVHFQRARLIALVQMTYVGAPMIYYGDEVGMWGADDPTNRKPMLWRDLEPYDNADENYVMEDHYAFYREAVALRRDHAALRVGTYRTLLVDDEQDLIAFEREHGGEVVLVAINASHAVASFDLPELASGMRWTPAFGSAPEGRSDEGVRAEVDAISGRVWTRTEDGD
ncbi:MAG: alpha-amylase family glycosyl hydrolase [Planctomycetota bacterium]